MGYLTKRVTSNNELISYICDQRAQKLTIL